MSSPAQHLRPYQFGAGQDPKAAQAKGAAAKRAKRELLAEGPRDVIAQALFRKRRELALAVEMAIEDAASANESTRKAARKDLAMLLNQGLGVIERREGERAGAEQGTLPTDREARMRLMAELEQRLAEDSD